MGRPLSVARITARASASGSGLRLTHGVGHRGSARSKRLGAAFGRVGGGLMLNLGIQLSSQQNDDRRHPHPYHQSDGGAQSAVGGVIVRVFFEIERQQRRGSDPEDAG